MSEDPSSITDGGHNSVQDVISRLRFISMLKPGERIDVTSLSIQPDTFLMRLYRTTIARGESRNTTLEFIRNTLNRAFDLIAIYKKTNDPFNGKISQMIVSSMNAAKSGVLSLIETYKDDRMYVSRVETLISTFDAKIDI
jgi:hypothetical protein